jgi:putative transposase
MTAGFHMAQLAGHYCHVYNRGCNRENIFVTADNYAYLLRQVKRILPGSLISIIAYCLLPNHYHFFARADTDDAISRFIQRLFSGYMQAFNKQQKRSGTLFEGRAKSVEVTDDLYAVHLCRYIHLNPVAAGLAQRPEDWPYSNYLEWIGQRPGMLVDREFAQHFYPRPGAYEDFIRSTIDEALALKLKCYYLDQ